MNRSRKFGLAAKVLDYTTHTSRKCQDLHHKLGLLPLPLTHQYHSKPSKPFTDHRAGDIGAIETWLIDCLIDWYLHQNSNIWNAFRITTFHLWPHRIKHILKFISIKQKQWHTSQRLSKTVKMCSWKGFSIDKPYEDGPQTLQRASPNARAGIKVPQKFAVRSNLLRQNK